MARKSTKTSVLPSKNKRLGLNGTGFYGTIAHIFGTARADRDWAKVFHLCRDAGLSSKETRDFLDSASGTSLAEKLIREENNRAEDIQYMLADYPITSDELKRDQGRIYWWKKSKRRE